MTIFTYILVLLAFLAMSVSASLWIQVVGVIIIIGYFTIYTPETYIEQ